MALRSKILIVDDNPTNIEILEEMLDEEYDLETATTGEQALEIVTEFQPALILLDIMMPGIDGYEVCRQIRSNPVLRNTKIIMVSARGMVSERLEGYKIGADDYVTKPFDEEELLSKARVFLRLKSVEEVDRFKTDMLSLLSHEVRTPLNCLILPADMLRSDEEMSTEQVNRFGEIMYQNTRRLQVFFEKVQVLSTMKSGNWRFEMTEADLCGVAREAIRDIAAVAEERRIQINEEFRPGSRVMLDPKEMKRVVLAMLDNAVRFSTDGGKIFVKVFGKNGDVCLTVTDQGEGIEPGFLPHVFDEFTDADIDHHTQGQGLSLALSRQIVLQHDGTISVESRKGSGTTFAVRLPAVSPRDVVSPVTGPRHGKEKEHGTAKQDPRRR